MRLDVVHKPRFIEMHEQDFSPMTPSMDGDPFSGQISSVKCNTATWNLYVFVFEFEFECFAVDRYQVSSATEPPGRTYVVNAEF